VTPTPGTSLLNYRLVEKIGEGGMGEVWKASDTTLGRDVAIKFLPASLASDPERLARFEREAKVLASLNHPNIAGIYGLHEVNGVRFIALELVPGDDLAQRLERGSVPVSESIDIARQIADGLEAAHDQGIVHRDLKPANVKLTPDGKVKILDFGLAKALDPVASGGRSSAGDSRMSPTVTSLGTVAGLILGTASYMSPEQAKGKPVDRRTDIWAFGCIVYELLAGKRPFEGEGISEVLAAVIMAPVAFDALPASTPAPLQRLVRRCLERDPKRRLRDIGEARLALEDIQTGKLEGAPPAPEGVATPSFSPLARAATIGATAVITALIAFGIQRASTPRPVEPPLRRFELPGEGPFRSTNQSRLIAISPNGQNLAYVDKDKLLVRPLARLEPTAIPTTAVPNILFWSPDSTMLGYSAAGKLWKVPATGGESTVITDVRRQLTGGSSASWCPDGTIVMTTGDSGVLSVSSAGGDFKEIVPLDQDKESDIHDATCLPDGSVLFAPHVQGGRPSELWLFADGKRKQLLKMEPDQDFWFPIYSPAGYILFHRRPANAGVWAVPFSLVKRKTLGEPFLVAANADVPSTSSDGTLVHVKSAATRLSQLVMLDRAGKKLATIGAPQEHWPFPELSPDGRYVAVVGRENEVDDIWILDVERGTKTRLSTSNTAYSREAWSPDGKSIVYSEGVQPPLELKIRPADGSGQPTKLRTGWDPSYSPDGKYLTFADQDKKTGWDIFTLELATNKTTTLVQSNAIELAPRVSPDGRYFVYVSDESGQDELYLKRFPGGVGRWQVSTDGGGWPRFSKKGDKIYYVKEDELIEIDCTLGDEPKLGVPRVLFKRRNFGHMLVFGWYAGFDVSADGQRFIAAEGLESAHAPSGIVVEENWSKAFHSPSQ
jgi:Tol biopolymer transport system component